MDWKNCLTNKSRTANRRLAKKLVQWLNEALCLVSSSVLADSFVLRNPLLRQEPKRYEPLHSMSTNIENNLPIWTVVANIVYERKAGIDGKEIKIGTKNFNSGTKVYVISWQPSLAENIVVVGLERKSKKFITTYLRADYIENLRVKIAHNPFVIKKIHEFHGEEQTYLTEKLANKMYSEIPSWQKKLRK